MKSSSSDVTEHLLGVLGDQRSREIIAKVNAEPRTVSELSDECSMPRSTVYRRVREMESEGLLIERVRMRRDGQHTKEYEVGFEDEEVEIDVMGSLVVTVSFEAVNEMPEERLSRLNEVTSG